MYRSIACAENWPNRSLTARHQSISALASVRNCFFLPFSNIVFWFCFRAFPIFFKWVYWKEVVFNSVRSYCVIRIYIYCVVCFVLSFEEKKYVLFIKTDCLQWSVAYILWKKFWRENIAVIITSQVLTNQNGKFVHQRIKYNIRVQIEQIPDSFNDILIHSFIRRHQILYLNPIDLIARNVIRYSFYIYYYLKFVRYSIFDSSFLAWIIIPTSFFQRIREFLLLFSFYSSTKGQRNLG